MRGIQKQERGREMRGRGERERKEGGQMRER